jgi:hypothetical protein
MIETLKQIPDKFWLMILTSLLLIIWLLSGKDTMIGTMLTGASGATLLALKGKQTNVNVGATSEAGPFQFESMQEFKRVIENDE